jgi:hypothetical protein
MNNIPGHWSGCFLNIILCSFLSKQEKIKDLSSLASVTPITNRNDDKKMTQAIEKWINPHKAGLDKIDSNFVSATIEEASRVISAF